MAVASVYALKPAVLWFRMWHGGFTSGQAGGCVGYAPAIAAPLPDGVEDVEIIQINRVLIRIDPRAPEDVDLLVQPDRGVPLK